MNQWLQKIFLYLQDIDRRSFYQWAGVFFLLLGSLTLFLLYYNRRTINNLTSQIKKINRLRDKVKIIVEKNSSVEKQHKEVDEILSESPNFKIRKYFIDLLENRGLKADTIETSEVTNVVDNRYDDITARSKLTNLTTKELAELLEAIEGNERVHIKNVEIIQKKPRSIDVTLTIATLLKKVEF